MLLLQIAAYLTKFTLKTQATGSYGCSLKSTPLFLVIIQVFPSILSQDRYIPGWLVVSAAAAINPYRHVAYNQHDLLTSS